MTADALRYTYLSFLLRQGIRAADFDRIVGRVRRQSLSPTCNCIPPGRGGQSNRSSVFFRRYTNLPSPESAEAALLTEG